VNRKRVYRLYTEDGLTVRTKVRKKLARRSRGVDAQSDTAQSEVEHGLHERETR
jgi:hypothetical protein